MRMLSSNRLACLRLLSTLAAVGSLAGCGVSDDAGDASEQTDHLHSDRGGIGVATEAFTGVSAIDARRSLAVTDAAILTNTNFSLTAVMNQLAAQSGIAGLTGTQLFKQLWDTQNPSPGLTTGPHCTDNGNTVNTFPYACRTSEGDQARNPATTITQYTPVGLFNRFDLAPSDGSDCGEYRIVFAKTSGGGRSFIIFEAVLLNPSPNLGLEGCRPVTDFWSNLSANNSVSSRAALLRDFYFNGLVGFQPVIHIDNYGAGTGRATGQVRVNEFITPLWMLREFKLRKTSATSLVFVPVSDKTNPFGGLFQPGSTSPLASEFQNTFFPSQVASLAMNDINGFNYVVPEKFDTGQSDSQSFGAVDDYVAQFGTGPSTLRANIQAQLNAIGSSLTPDNIVARAEALSCAGCHQRSAGASLGGGLVWPSSAGFVHATEFTESGPDGTRFQLSSALTGTFLPHRKQVLDNFNRTYQKCTASTAPLAAGTDACVADVCNVDPHCCTTAWDSTCVSEVESVCHDLICPANQGTCAHTPCTIGINLASQCDLPPATSSCVADVCNVDPFCCDTFWDGTCVGEVGTICGDSCQ